MFEFFLMLFFANTTELTSVPIVINPSTPGYEIVLEAPISAITDGASLRIDVSEMLTDKNFKDIPKMRENIAGIFSENSIRGKLIGESGSVDFNFTGNTAIGADEVLLGLYSTTGSLRTNVEYDRVVINTNITLENIRIYWKNHSK